MTWQTGLKDFITQRSPLESRRCNATEMTDFYAFSQEMSRLRIGRLKI